MIISRNTAPSMPVFRELMAATDNLLNEDAKIRPEYYAKRNGTALETDVFHAISRCAEHTPFADTIELVSGAAFPDIVAARYYGVEVKSTNKNHWTSTGSSVLESTRIKDVEHIFLTFGKLGAPIEFLSRPYQDCMSDISVTHYPRYRIDMRLKPGETIFDKMGVDYDVLRKMDEPEKPIAEYYKARLKPGQRLWWAGSSPDEIKSAPPILCLWTSLNAEQKNFYTVKGYALFPEILGNSSTKYQQYALWLATDCSVLNTNIRDQFSAGGKVNIKTDSGLYSFMPAAFGRVAKNRELIEETILTTPEALLLESWNQSRISNDRMRQWCELAAEYAASGDALARGKIQNMLYDIFIKKGAVSFTLSRA